MPNPHYSGLSMCLLLFQKQVFRVSLFLTVFGYDTVYPIFAWLVLHALGSFQLFCLESLRLGRANVQTGQFQFWPSHRPGKFHIKLYLFLHFNDLSSLNEPFFQRWPKSLILAKGGAADRGDPLLRLLVTLVLPVN